MLKLLSYPPAFGQPSASAFCVKAMYLLHMAGQDWQAEFNADPRKAPKQKLPVLIDGAVEIPDSEAIRSHLEAKTNIDFDQGLTRAQRATSRAVIRMVEEHLYFAIVCDRWLIDENWQYVKAALFGKTPAPIRGIVTKKIRKQARAQVLAQGMGRHSVAEQFVRAELDISAISNLLEAKKFLFGEVPTAADASVAPMLAALIGSPSETTLSARVKNDAKLVEYCQRVSGALGAG